MFFPLDCLIWHFPKYPGRIHVAGAVSSMEHAHDCVIIIDAFFVMEKVGSMLLMRTMDVIL